MQNLILNENETKKVVLVELLNNWALVCDTKDNELYKWELKAKCLQGLQKYLLNVLRGPNTTRKTVKITRHKDINKTSKGKQHHESNIEVQQTITGKKWYPIHYNLIGICEKNDNTYALYFPKCRGGDILQAGYSLEGTLNLYKYCLDNGYPKEICNINKNKTGNLNSEILGDELKDGNKLTTEGIIKIYKKAMGTKRKREKPKTIKIPIDDYKDMQQQLSELTKVVGLLQKQVQ